jgi:hypothetical protein
VGAPQLQQQDVLHILQQQQQQQQQHMGGLGVTPGPTSGPSSSSGSNKPNSGEVLGLTQVIRSWTVQTMVDRVFPVSIPSHMGCVWIRNHPVFCGRGGVGASEGEGRVSSVWVGGLQSQCQ